jgi:hypothetical protein
MDQHQENYSRLIIEILPADILFLEDEIKNRNDFFSKLTHPERDDYDFKNIAYFHTTNKLVAAVDALKSLQLLNHGTPAGISINVTVNGVGGLLRQALESLGWARWLSKNVNELEEQRKGYFFALDDLLERRKYYNALGQQEEMDKADKLVKEWVDYGVLQNYYEASAVSIRTGVLERKPKYNLPSITDICQAIELNTSIISPEILAEYPGMKTASWLFRWSSGIAHGKHWVNTFEPSHDELSVTTPNYLNLTLIIFAIHDLVTGRQVNPESCKDLNDAT